MRRSCRSPVHTPGAKQSIHGSEKLSLIRVDTAKVTQGIKESRCCASIEEVKGKAPLPV
jgi:hypothetical protein